MSYQTTTATNKLLQLKKRIKGISGGTSASKTVSILIILTDIIQSYQGKLTISVVSETMPHLKRGAIRDFLSIAKEGVDDSPPFYDDSKWNRTDFIYDFGGGKIIEFFSAEQEHKVRGPRRDILFINEGNNISYETYTQLEIRTKIAIFVDWNPVSEFWWYTEIQGKSDVDFLTLTYKDNEALDQAIVETIESRKHLKNWWSIYGLGQLGEAEGRIYTGWRQIKGIPNNAQLIRYGLDFGYTNDPTAIVAIYKFNDWLILDQIIYQKGLSNKQIASIFQEIPEALIRADSSEPKSIDEIRMYGVKIIPALKGPGSVLAGIQFVQQQKIAITERSIDGIKEYRNYLWMTDREGRIINEPSGEWNHFLDALRYGLDDMRLHRQQNGGVVRISNPNNEVPKSWTARSDGAIPGPDFIKGFKEMANQRKSTAAAEFKR